MNFSISGGTDPWIDNDRRKLDLVDADVLVAASAGNTSAGVPDPVGQVNHRGPWVLTVAASTKDQVLHDGLVSASGPGSPPPDTQNIGPRPKEVLRLTALRSPIFQFGILPVRIQTSKAVYVPSRRSLANFF